MSGEDFDEFGKVIGRFGRTAWGQISAIVLFSLALAASVHRGWWLFVGVSGLFVLIGFFNLIRILRSRGKPPVKPRWRGGASV
jgi:hypothetical protein